MIHVKVEKIGDSVAIVLDDAAQKLLGVAPGDIIGLEGAIGSSAGDDNSITRGKLFVERYLKTFRALAQ